VLHHHVLHDGSLFLLLRSLIIILRASVSVFILTMQVRRLVHILALTLTLPLISLLLPREIWVVSPTLVIVVGIRVIVNTSSTNLFHLFQGLSIWGVSNHMSCLPTLIPNRRWRCGCHHLCLSIHQSLHFLCQHIHLLFKR